MVATANYETNPNSVRPFSLTGLCFSVRGIEIHRREWDWRRRPISQAATLKTSFVAPSILASLRAAGVEFIDENGADTDGQEVIQRRKKTADLTAYRYSV